MENSHFHILVCDDELDVREMVQEDLGKRGFKVSAAANSEELRTILSVNPIDLIILDINMPREDDLTTLRSLRIDDQTPVVMLTAAGEVVDRIIGLEMGADDYLGKPVDLRELEVRVKAVLRRRGTADQKKAEKKTPGTAKFGDFTLDIEAAKMHGPEGDEVALTAMEFSLLKAFAKTRAGCSIATRSWSRPTTAPGTRSTAVSTSASPDCAARSRKTRKSRPSFVRCVASAISTIRKVSRPQSSNGSPIYS